MKLVWPFIASWLELLIIESCGCHWFIELPLEMRWKHKRITTKQKWIACSPRTTVQSTHAHFVTPTHVCHQGGKWMWKGNVYSLKPLAPDLLMASFQKLFIKCILPCRSGVVCIKHWRSEICILPRTYYMVLSKGVIVLSCICVKLGMHCQVHSFGWIMLYHQMLTDCLIGQLLG